MKDLFSVSIIEFKNNNKLCMFSANLISQLDNFLNKIPTNTDLTTDIFFHHFLIDEGFTLKIYGENSYVYTKSDILNSRFDEESIYKYILYYELLCHRFDENGNVYEDVGMYNYIYNSKDNIGIEYIPINLITF
jgi:hypothetical protein